MSNAAEQKYYYPPLDGLRGLAVLMVLLCHLFSYITVFQAGWISVDLFFAISGFLITGILLRHRDNRHFLRNFYIRRALRILPMYYVTLVVIIFLLPTAITGSFDMAYFRDNQLWFWLYGQNWLLVLKDPNRNVLLNHFWTLAVEEQFYILWPLVTLLIRRPGRLLFVIGLIFLFTIGWRITVWQLHFSNISYENLYKFTRIEGLCAGSSLAVLVSYKSEAIRKYARVIIATITLYNLLILVIKFTICRALPYWGLAGYATISVGWGLLIHKCLFQPNRITQTLFASSLLQYFGKISYSLYLLHWPVYLLAAPFVRPFLVDHFNLTGRWNAFGVSVVSLSASIILGNICYHLIERYFMRLKLVWAPYAQVTKH